MGGVSTTAHRTIAKLSDKKKVVGWHFVKPMHEVAVIEDAGTPRVSLRSNPSSLLARWRAGGSATTLARRSGCGHAEKVNSPPSARVEEGMAC